MEPYILLHMLYLPRRHEYICVICHSHKHVVAHFAHKLYLPHRHEYICIICQIGMDAVAYVATQVVSAARACMQAHNLPHMHARTALSGTLARMSQHNLLHMRLHNLPHSALLVVCAA